MIELPSSKIKATRVNPKKLILFSKPKVGKTEMLSALDNCLLIDLEDGSEFVNAMKINVLDIARKNEISPISALKEVISNCTELANEKSINIKFINSKKDSIVKGDKEKLTVLFKNILDNAIKYSSPNTEISFEANSKNGKVLIAIRDQGIGIPKKDILRITERFYRSDNGKKLKIKGRII